LDQALNAAGNERHCLQHLRIFRRRQFVKFRRTIRTGGIHAFQSDQVEVNVQAERRIEALHERHGAALGLLQSRQFPSPAAKLAEDRAHEDA
jgi:hypothetical protein